MRYFVCELKENGRDILDKCADEGMAFKRLKYYIKKKKPGLTVMPVPELKVGCRMFRRDGSYYRTITGETGTLWLISKDEGHEGMPDPCSKQRMDQVIANNDLIVVDGDMHIEAMEEITSGLDEKVDAVKKTFENPSVEQLKIL